MIFISDYNACKWTKKIRSFKINWNLQALSTFIEFEPRRTESHKIDLGMRLLCQLHKNRSKYQHACHIIYNWTYIIQYISISSFLKEWNPVPAHDTGTGAWNDIIARAVQSLRPLHCVLYCSTDLKCFTLKKNTGQTIKKGLPLHDYCEVYLMVSLTEWRVNKFGKWFKI